MEERKKKILSYLLHPSSGFVRPSPVFLPPSSIILHKGEMMKKLNHAELLYRQSTRLRGGQAAPNTRLPFCVLLNNIRSLYNVGSIFRTADGVSIEKVWICGITGFPPDSKITKTALGAETTVPWEYVKDARECISKLKAQGYQIVMLEQAHQSQPYQDFVPQQPFCLVLGNETGGVGEDLLPLCDAAVEIEMAGLKNSLNVTVAFGVAVYHFRNTILKKSKMENK